MKKVIRLTETQLKKVIGKIMEQSDVFFRPDDPTKDPSQQNTPKISKPMNLGKKFPKKPVDPNVSKLFVNKTVNLYSDRSNRELMHRIKIIGINEVAYGVYEIIFSSIGRFADSGTENMQFSCEELPGRGFIIINGKGRPLYNIRFEKALKDALCGTSAGGSKVPKADFTSVDTQSSPTAIAEGRLRKIVKDMIKRGE